MNSITFENIDDLIQQFPQIMKITVSPKNIEDLVTCMCSAPIVIGRNKPDMDVKSIFYKDIEIERFESKLEKALK